LHRPTDPKNGFGPVGRDTLRVISVACNALTWAYGALCNTYTIFEGTSEIQRLVIARAISGIHIN
jgi:alkylation response protein AidB-like acyl-CoA dehydrogenase